MSDLYRTAENPHRPEPPCGVGPRMTDEEFFLHQLNADREDLKETIQAAQAGDYAKARALFAAAARNSLDPERFFSIPYEIPENHYMSETETEIEAAERILKNQIMSCGTLHDFGEEIDWYANPTFNGYKEWTWQISRHPEWKLLAHVYNQTQDERYAQAVARFFESWVHQATVPDDCDGSHTLCWRTIECGIRMGANWPYVLHTFYKTSAFTDEVIVDWYKSVCEHGERLQKHHRTGNWLVMEMNGLAHIGILYPVLARAEEWYDFAIQMLEEELGRQVYPDGFQVELTTNYHEVVLNNYHRLFLTMNAYGRQYPEHFAQVMKEMAMVNVNLMRPTKNLPDLNDGNMSYIRDFLKEKLDMVGDVPQVRWGATDGKEGKEPEYTSLSLPYSGFAVMRTGWSREDSYVLFDGAPFGTGHQHEDKLNLIYQIGERMILCDGGNYAYDDSEMRKYVLSTRSHNTIRVDGMDQNRKKGYHFDTSRDVKRYADLRFVTQPDFDFALSFYTQGYGTEQDQDVTHQRSVFFIKKPEAGDRPILVVVDRLLASKQHDYEVLWHLNAESAELISDRDCDTVKVNYGSVNVQQGADELARTEKAEARPLGFFATPSSGSQIVCGQEEPWQGFIPGITHMQLDYLPIPTACMHYQGTSLRIVTVLTDNDDIVGIEKPSKDIADTQIVFKLSDGGTWTISETEYQD